MTDKDAVQGDAAAAGPGQADYLEPLGPVCEGDWRADEALDMGACCYRKAMAFEDAADREKRLRYFRAAEHYYRISAAAGHPQAAANLGYVYSYDRCEGRYEDTACADEQGRLRRALEYCLDAADVGSPESWCKAGDLVVKTDPSEAGAERALGMWRKAFELSRDTPYPVVWGSAAIRIAGAYERGRGTSRDLDRALSWYRIAEAGLDAAVREGEEWYRRQLGRAQDGVARVQQELSGEY
jgi:TPR repeat protein